MAAIPARPMHSAVPANYNYVHYGPQGGRGLQLMNLDDGTLVL